MSRFYFPITVAVTQSGVGGVLFQAADMYTATLDENGQPIPGLANANIRLQNEAVTTVEYTATTDANGEALLTAIPAGRYRYRVTASNHESATGRVSIQPGITAFEYVFLDHTLVTVEWSVTEITIEDRYEITLNAIFETDVPAAVLVFEPASTTLPVMQEGDVFYGEWKLTNHGLIEARNLELIYDEDDPYWRYEFLSDLPDILEPKETITLPVRIVAKQNFDPATSGTSGGGGCFSHAAEVVVGHDYQCPDGTVRHKDARELVSVFVGDSCGSTSGDTSDDGYWERDGVANAACENYTGPRPPCDSGTSAGDPLPGAKCAPDCIGETCCKYPGGG